MPEQAKIQNEVPLYIKVSAMDNVAIIVNSGGLAKGCIFERTIASPLSKCRGCSGFNS